MRGEARVEDLIETAAYGADCMDDATFVRTVFTLLLGRSPGEAEVQSLIGVPRVASRFLPNSLRPSSEWK